MKRCFLFLFVVFFFCNCIREDDESDCCAHPVATVYMHDGNLNFDEKSKLNIKITESSEGLRFFKQFFSKDHHVADIKEVSLNESFSLYEGGDTTLLSKPLLFRVFFKAAPSKLADKQRFSYEIIDDSGTKKCEDDITIHLEKHSEITELNANIYAMESKKDIDAIFSKLGSRVYHMNLDLKKITSESDKDVAEKEK